LAAFAILAAMMTIALRGNSSTDAYPDGPDSTNELANGYCEKAMSIIRNDTYREFGEAYTNFHRAIELDSNFARPYVGLLEFRLREPAPFLTKTETLPELANKLKSLAPRLGPTITAQAIVSYYDWDFGAAERFAAQAVKISPRYELGHTWYGFMLSHWNRSSEARAEFEKSKNLQPSKAIIRRCIGHTYYAERDFATAIKFYQQAIELDGHHAQDFFFKARAQRALGNYAESMVTDFEARRVAGQNPTAISNHFALLRQALGAGGPKGYWEEAWRNSETSSMSLYDKASILIHTGDTNGALKLLEESFNRNENRGREGGLPFLLFDEWWAPIRENPRFKKLLEEVSFTKVAKTGPDIRSD
jgi:tetratricopeptide (TPR) repeat protein